MKAPLHLVAGVRTPFARMGTTLAACGADELGRTAAAALLARHHREGSFIGLDDLLSRTTRDLQELLESHVEHPVTHYFHPIEVHDGLPRLLFLALETAAVLRAFPDPSRYPEVCDHPALASLEETAKHAIAELAASLRMRVAAQADSPAPAAPRLAARIGRTRSGLARAGIVLRSDAGEADQTYLAHRSAWEGGLRSLAGWLGYDWEEVTGDADVRAAADADRIHPEA